MNPLNLHAHRLLQKLLEVDGAVGSDFIKGKTLYFRTPNEWQPDTERIERVIGLRRAEMENSAMQARNVIGTLSIRGNVPSEPVLLIDDIIDSGWSLTVAGNLLRERGCGKVFPFTLAQASGRSALK